jgi:lipoate-protein ligase A
LNLARCKDYTITRRISGGGMAFSDNSGRQINYGVVGVIDNDRFPLNIIESYKQICGVLIDTITDYGLNAAFRPINDVIVDNKKISGNAQTRWEGKLLQNGTLLLDFDIEEIRNVMNRKFEERFKVKLKTENLSEKEEELTQTFLPKYYSDEWVYR